MSRRRNNPSPPTLYFLSGVLILAAAQSLSGFPTAYYIFMGIGGLVCLFSVIKIFRP